MLLDLRVIFRNVKSGTHDAHGKYMDHYKQINFPAEKKTNFWSFRPDPCHWSTEPVVIA